MYTIESFVHRIRELEALNEAQAEEIKLLEFTRKVMTEDWQKMGKRCQEYEQLLFTILLCCNFRDK